MALTKEVAGAQNGSMLALARQFGSRRFLALMALILAAIAPAVPAQAVSYPPHGIFIDDLVRVAPVTSCEVDYTHGNAYGHAFLQIKAGASHYQSWQASSIGFPTAGYKFNWYQNYPNMAAYGFQNTVMCSGVSGKVIAWNGSILANFSGVFVNGTALYQIDSVDAGCCWSILGSEAWVHGADESAFASKAYAGV